MNDGKILNEYIQVDPPMKENMTRAINEIKGADRTMNELASATGLSISMLSRIVNGNYIKPIDVKTLELLISHASKNSNIIFEELLRYNGMLTKKEFERRKDNSHRKQRIIEQRKYRQDMREIIIDELFSREIAIKKRKKIGIDRNIRSYIGERMDEMVISLPDEKNMTWAFYMASAYRVMDESREESERYVRRLIDRNAMIFLNDAWEPEKMENTKCSFVFIDETYFECFTKFMKKAKLHNRMSAILIDIKKRKVSRECIFDCRNFKNQINVFQKGDFSNKMNFESDEIIYDINEEDDIW